MQNVEKSIDMLLIIHAQGQSVAGDWRPQGVGVGGRMAAWRGGARLVQP